MFLPHLRAIVSARGPASIAAHIHTTRLTAADFTAFGQTVGGEVKLAADKVETKTTDKTYTYAKQQDVTPEPRVSHTGTRTYVVSPEDDTAPYDVPGGEYWCRR